jgi:hypothetical protein
MVVSLELLVEFIICVHGDRWLQILSSVRQNLMKPTVRTVHQQLDNNLKLGCLHPVACIRSGSGVSV